MKQGDRADRIGGAFFSVGVVTPSTLENVVYMSIMAVDEHWRKEQGQDRIDGAFFSVGVVAPSTLENVLSLWVYNDGRQTQKNGTGRR